VSIGDHVAIDDFTYVTTSLEIGSYVHIGPLRSIIGGKIGQCSMEDFSGLAAGCRLVCAPGDSFGSGLLHDCRYRRYDSSGSNARRRRGRR
jgi:hypothetical protein